MKKCETSIKIYFIFKFNRYIVLCQINHKLIYDFIHSFLINNNNNNNNNKNNNCFCVKYRNGFIAFTLISD
jgi:hypothetical protein